MIRANEDVSSILPFAHAPKAIQPGLNCRDEIAEVFLTQSEKADRGEEKVLLFHFGSDYGFFRSFASFFETIAIKDLILIIGLSILRLIILMSVHESEAGSEKTFMK